MVSFESFIMSDGPIYQQIILFIKREISAKNIINGDELPSRRVLSALLGVNPNTVQKAYKTLEDEGLIESHTGSKSMIVISDKIRADIRSELAESEIAQAVRTLKQMGISKDEALSLISKFWNEGD